MSFGIVLVIVKPKYAEKAELCYMDGFIVCIKPADNYKDIAEHIKTRFDTSNQELHR